MGENLPKGAILYFSTTGNTKLACEYLSRRIPQVEFDLIDIRSKDGFDPSEYEFIGFASYCDFQGIPQLIIDRIGSLPEGNGKPAFFLITFAAIHGHAPRSMKKSIEERGYKVLSGYVLRMPENYSPLRKKGMKGDENPNEKDLGSFRTYIRSLSDDLVAHHLGKEVSEKKVKIGLFNTFFKGTDRQKAKREMGAKKVDAGLCTKCGICERSCPYNAIKMEQVPVFNEGKCMGCFTCYNLCPIGAISTTKLTSEYQYSGPPEELKKKMSY